MDDLFSVVILSHFGFVNVSANDIAEDGRKTLQFQHIGRVSSAVLENLELESIVIVSEPGTGNLMSYW